MCLTVQDFVSEVKVIDSLLELSFFIHDETGNINKSSSALGSKTPEGPARRDRMPVSDLCEDG